ncbi:hypothetical protein CPAV1605_762 [seawater metagenome]|uniref:Aminoglycoside phosphotransferase domain-containing protein n=1 Tax=seawater metagenome TaxID=1561972 RepID=A0A5E8CIV9_9ZZZZ
MKSLLDIFNFIRNPKMFPLGADIEKIAILNKDSSDNKIFYKKFKKNKLEQYTKTIFILNYLKDLDFVPKIVKKNDKELELYLTYCGQIATIQKLPKNWKEQLNKIKSSLIKKEVSFVDWGLWDVNPYVLNNVCILNNKIYLIDIGDCEFKDENYIQKYFNKEIYKINEMVNNSYIFIIKHYLRGILNIFYRKLSRLHNIIILFLLIKIFFQI